MDNYVGFYGTATGRSPLPYQQRLHASRIGHTTISIPTGLGKTDAVLVDWLARRPTTRLIWCLPGRALTGQVAAVARDRIARCGLKVRVLELMGGSEDLDLSLTPDQPAVLVGTQDILISRALNRGYARSPFRWPIDFALLNNDAEWVFDEVQLLGDALATGCQLAAFRERFGVFGKVPTVWMSATLDPSWLRTVDFQEQDINAIALDERDLEHPLVCQRINAAKQIAAAPSECRSPEGCAKFAAAKHRAGTRTLVIANTVDRAREIWTALLPLYSEPVLLHSRFRPGDRDRNLSAALGRSDGIIVSTQVIEAGIDIDADLLVTDIAPWPSLVQRFGRVNRYGEKTDSQIFWIDRPLSAKTRKLTSRDLKPSEAELVFAPYEVSDVGNADKILTSLLTASPSALGATRSAAPYQFVLRRADLLDLFDTTPDLAGNHIDVSRFVRSGKEHDVYVAWRDWAGDEPDPATARLGDNELCPVPVNQFRDFAEDHPAWTWSHIRDGGWRPVERQSLYPGAV